MELRRIDLVKITILITALVALILAVIYPEVSSPILGSLVTTAFQWLVGIVTKAVNFLAGW